MAHKGCTVSQSPVSLGSYVPKEMTPMDWKIPPLMVKRGVLNEPLSSEATKTPCTRTVTTMTIMPISANVLALASYLEY